MKRLFSPYRVIVAAIILLFVLLTLNVMAQSNTSYPILTLAGRAVLPADTFAEGPASGSALEITNGRTPPFEGQPVQGFSAILPGADGNWLVLQDNGFGAKGNSGDINLRWYEVKVDFEQSSVDVMGFTQLSDPDKLIPFPIVNNDTSERLLTGSDFDIESFRQAADGTYWIGDEFGPYLLHVDASGKVLEAPYDTPYPEAFKDFARGLDFVQSPDNPAFVALADADARRAAANLPGSRGFEGMALNSSGTALYPLLEGRMTDDTAGAGLIIQEFDLVTKAYTGKYWLYPLSLSTNAIGDMTAINDNEFLVIERDGGEGVAAAFKRVYKVNISSVGEDGVTLNKTLVADLLAIYDAANLTAPEDGAVGLGPVFKFPFVTIESVWPLDANTLVMVNDNNYPFSAGRRPGTPDDNEFILLGLPEALNLAE